VSGKDDQRGDDRQLSLPLRTEPRRAFRVIQGEGQRRDETLHDKNDVARLLVGAAVDMMHQRISVERNSEIQRRVDRVLRLFDLAGDDPVAMVLLRRQLDELEKIYREGRDQKRSRR
jgi:hypothetical protein